MLTPQILAGRGQIINEPHVHIGRETWTLVCLMSSSRKTTQCYQSETGTQDKLILTHAAVESVGKQSITWTLEATAIYKWQGQSS